MGRYNRYTRHRNSGMGLSIFIFIIVLAVATGYAGTKYVIFPYLLDSKSPNSNSEGLNADGSSGAGIDVTTSLPSIILDQQDIKDLSSKSAVETGSSAVIPQVASGATNLSMKGPFSVQFGSFATKEGADVLSKQLTQKGIYSYVYESRGTHKVLGLPYADKEMARKAAIIVSSAVADVFVVDMASLIQ